jgi:hypothetical protein
MRASAATGHKALQDLRGLPRSPMLSYLQKQVVPDSPRSKSPDKRPSRFPLIRAFTPGRLWDFVCEYRRNKGPTLEAEYVDLYGEVAFSESWEIKDGQITRLCWR